MIEVKSNKKTETPGKERLNSMEGLRQTVTAIPKRKIGVAMIAFVGLIAYLKTILGGSEAAAQSAPNGQFKQKRRTRLSAILIIHLPTIAVACLMAMLSCLKPPSATRKTAQ